eukprot:scaffold111736_cov63-Phaeocystis_antarctica.AAC.2
MSGSQRCKHAQLVGREVVSASVTVSVMQRAKRKELYTPLARSARHWYRTSVVGVQCPRR